MGDGEEDRLSQLTMLQVWMAENLYSKDALNQIIVPVLYYMNTFIVTVYIVQCMKGFTFQCSKPKQNSVLSVTENLNHYNIWGHGGDTQQQ